MEKKSDIREAMESYYDSATLWFGKHKGIELSKVPKDYLVWLRTTDQYKTFSKSLKGAISYNINNSKA